MEKYLELKHIKSIKDLKELNPSFVDSLNEERKNELIEVIKKKEGYEIEFRKEFWKRFSHERNSTTLYMIDDIFGYLSPFQQIYYEIFIQKSYWKPIIDSIIKNEILKMNYRFYFSVINTNNFTPFSRSIEHMSKNVQELLNLENNFILRTEIPEHEWIRIIKDKFKGKIFEDFSYKDFEDTINNGEIFIEEDAKMQNCYIIYSQLKKTATFYFRKTVSLGDLNNVGMIRRFLKKLYGIKDVSMVCIKNEQQFNEYNAKISELIAENVNKIKMIKDTGLKVWLINSLSDSDVGDFSFFYNKKTNFHKHETFYKNVGKVIDNLNDTSIDIISSDLQEIFRVQQEGDNTDSGFNIGRVSYRINIYSCDESFTITIRRNTSNIYTIKELEQGSGIELEGLIWKNTTEEQKYPLVNKSHKKIRKLDGKIINFKEIGVSDFFPESEIIKIEKELDKNNGFNIISGDTGTGKSTFLRAAYQKIFNKYVEKGINKKIVYIENPVEDYVNDFYQISFKGNDGLRVVLEETMKRARANITVVGEARNNFEFQSVLNLTQLTQTSTTMHKKSILEILGFILNNNWDQDIKEIFTKANLFIVFESTEELNIKELLKENPNERENLKLFKFFELEEIFVNVFGSVIKRKDIIDFLKNHKITPINWNKTQIDKKLLSSYINTNKKLYEIAYSNEILELFKKYANKFGVMGKEEEKNLKQNMFDIYEIIGLEKTFQYQYLSRFLLGILPDSQSSKLYSSLENIKNWKNSNKEYLFNKLKEDFPLKEKEE